MLATTSNASAADADGGVLARRVVAAIEPSTAPAEVSCVARLIKGSRGRASRGAKQRAGRPGCGSSKREHGARFAAAVPRLGPRRQRSTICTLRAEHRVGSDGTDGASKVAGAILPDCLVSHSSAITAKQYAACANSFFCLAMRARVDAVPYCLRAVSRRFRASARPVSG